MHKVDRDKVGMIHFTTRLLFPLFGRCIYARVFVVKTEGKKKIGNNSRMTWPGLEPGTPTHRYRISIGRVGMIHSTTRSSCLPFKGVFILDFSKGEKNEWEKNIKLKAKKDDLARV
jgi:hypothetical protein